MLDNQRREDFFPLFLQLALILDPHIFLKNSVDSVDNIDCQWLMLSTER